MEIRSSLTNAFDPVLWDAFSKEAETGHLLQSWGWGELKAPFGWLPIRVAALEHGHIVAAAQVLCRHLPLDLVTLAYMPRGPMLSQPLSLRSPDSELIEAVLSTCRRRRAVMLKLEPEWLDTEVARQWMSAWRLSASSWSVQPRRTVLVDLRSDEDDILAQMKPKTRYNIRLAERKGIVVAQGTADDLPDFHRLLLTTGERASFGVHTLDYYRRAWGLFRERDSVALFLARYSGRTLAAILVIAWGKTAYYMYGGSSDEERQRMPTYLLQWEAMRWAKARGRQLYDLWGIPDVDESEVGEDIQAAEASGVLSHGMGGLYRFKRGFGGQETRYIGACDAVLNPVLYPLMMALWKHRSQARPAQ